MEREHNRALTLTHKFTMQKCRCTRMKLESEVGESVRVGLASASYIHVLRKAEKIPGSNPRGKDQQNED